LPNESGIFTQFRNSFLASDIAWFAAGASEDNTDYIQSNSFHPLFKTLRENLPTGPQDNQLRNEAHSNLHQLTFDLVSLFTPLRASH
jgi:hypothetical protein